MNSVKNHVQLIGHLGADPEVKTTTTGKTFVNIRLATSERFKNAKDEWQEDTQWHNITFWDQMALRAKDNLTKGSMILVQGKLINRSYDDAQGQKKYIYEVRPQSWLLLDKKSSETVGNQHTDMKDDDIPF